MELLYKTQKQLYLLYSGQLWPFIKTCHLGITNAHTFYSEIKFKEGGGLLEEAALFQIVGKCTLMQACEYFLQKIKVALCCIFIDQYIIQENRFFNLSSISMNRLFIVWINITGAFIKPIGITTHSCNLYQVRNTIIAISYSAINFAITHFKD